jgi:hypothetical protein
MSRSGSDNPLLLLRHAILFAFCLAPAALAAAPALPAVNLLVDVRVVDEAQASGHGDYTVSTRALAPPPVETLQLQVMNGQTGALRLGRALPVQWLQAAARGAAASAPADRAGAVAYAVTWVPSGHSLTVRPQWAGGSSAVTLDLQFTSTTLQPKVGAALPATRTQQAGTTLRLPLNAWVSFAATGAPHEAAEPGAISTLSLAERGRQWLQVRVTLP